jgi:spore germination protein YaaH
MRRLMLVALVLLLVPWMLSHVQDAVKAAAPDSWCVAVWYPSSTHPDGALSITANTDIIDIVHAFWYSPRADGTLIAHSGAEDADKLAEWRDAGLLVIPSIFSSIFDPLMDDTLRARHVDEIVALVERMDYDGIDIDYEGFPLITREPFTLFVEALSEALHTRERLLAVTVHARTEETAYESALAQDWERLAAAADVFNLMTYDYTSRNRDPGPIAPATWARDVLGYAESVTDLGNVRLGLPFYGYSWLRGNPPATSVAWDGVMRWVESFELEVIRDPDSQEMQIELRARGLPRQNIFLADSVSTAHKLDVTTAAHPLLGGIAIWGLGGEDPQHWDVLRGLPDQPPCVFTNR